jgi:hypothetical protein
VSDCDACIYTGCDGADEPEFCNVVVRKSRKLRICCECHETILPGTRYERTSGKWDGKVSSYNTCEPCAEIRQAFCCDGWVYGTLWEDAQEGFFESMSTACLDKLTSAAAKAKLLKEWNAWKFD